MKQYDHFGEYMFDLLFAPLKKGKRAVNQFFIFFKVIGRVFDGLKEDALRVRDETNIATASPVMLPVHGQDRNIPPPPPPAKYEDAVGWERIEDGYKQALRGKRKYTREAVTYDLLSEVNNVELWRALKAIKARPDPAQRQKEYRPGPYRHKTITEPKTRSLNIPQLRDKIVQLAIHEELQSIFRPVFVDRSFACQYGKGPIRAAFNVQHDMRVARMK